MSAVNVAETDIPARFLQIAEDHVEELEKMVTDGEDPFFFFFGSPLRTLFSFLLRIATQRRNLAQVRAQRGRSLT